MKTILEKLLSNLTTPSLQGRVRGGSVILFLLASITTSAQCVKLEKRMNSLINEYSEELCTNKTINETRDPYKLGRPLTSKCEIYNFTLKKKDSYQRELLDEMLRALETEGREDSNCYSVNSMSESANGDIMGEMRRLMIGEDTEDYIEIGKDYNHFYNVNAIDTADATKSHRYAYAVEWREKGKTIDLRYIVTYAKIPSATTTITNQNWPYIEFGRSRIHKDSPIQAENKARAYYLGKEYSIQSLDSLINEAQLREKENYKKIKEAIQREGEVAKKMQKAFVNGNSVVVWSDSLDHDIDPVTDAVLRLQQGKGVTADDLVCNDNILLIFSQLKQQYLAGKNTEFNAISIYTLCKKAREYGFFTGKYSKEELGQLKDEVITLYNKTEDKTCSRYLKMAIDELEKIE